MAKSFIDKLFEDKTELDKVIAYPIRVKHSVVIERFDELNNERIYIPIQLQNYLKQSYYENLPQEEIERFIKSDKIHKTLTEESLGNKEKHKNLQKFIYADLIEWIRENPKWENIAVKR